jgi:hypothetical protein
MAGGSIAAALLAIALWGVGNGREILLGLLAPLLVTIGSWVAAERTYRRDPERLTSVMISGFAGKLVLFGAYVAVVVTTVPDLAPRPFVVSFTVFFIALHMAEAICLRRLFAGDSRGSR